MKCLGTQGRKDLQRTRLGTSREKNNSAAIMAAGTTAHQRCALAGWAVSLVVSTVWIRFVVGCPVWPDVASGFVSHLIALSVLWLDPRLLPPLGCAVMGVCVGLMLVDMAFDLVIIREGSVRLGPTTVTPGRCARPRVPGGAIGVGCRVGATGVACRAASTLPRASRPPPRVFTHACTCVRTHLHACVDGVRAYAILAPSWAPLTLSRARCRTVATPLPRTRCSVEAVGLPFAYPRPTLGLPYAYPMPTVRLQAGGAPLLQHDAQRAAHQHCHVDRDALPRPRRGARAGGVPRHPEGARHDALHDALTPCMTPLRRA